VEVNLGNYKKIYDNWQKDPKTFWKEQTRNIHWEKNPVKILDDDNKPFYKWYPDGSLNTCFNAVDRHVLNGRENKMQSYMIVLLQTQKENYLFRT